MPTYDVVTEDLEAVQQQLGQQVQGLDQSQAETTQAVDGLITQTDAATAQGQARITGTLGDLAQTVATSDQVAAAAQWTGADSDRFRQGNAELRQAIDQTGQRMNDAIAAFQARTAQADAELQALTAQFADAVARCRDLTAELQAAVQVEAQSLEEAFNGSFAYGG